MVAKRTWARGEFFRRAGHTAFAPQKLPMWKGELLATAAGGEEPFAKWFEVQVLTRIPSRKWIKEGVPF